MLGDCDGFSRAMTLIRVSLLDPANPTSAGSKYVAAKLSAEANRSSMETSFKIFIFTPLRERLIEFGTGKH